LPLFWQEIQSPKSEANPNDEKPEFRIPANDLAQTVWGLDIWNFRFVSDFVLRALVGALPR